MTGRDEAYSQPSWTQRGSRRGGAMPPYLFLRWNPFPIAENHDFVEGRARRGANGDVEAQVGMAALVYGSGRSMTRRALVNADGEMLLIPQ